MPNVGNKCKPSQAWFYLVKRNVWWLVSYFEAIAEISLPGQEDGRPWDHICNCRAWEMSHQTTLIWKTVHEKMLLGELIAEYERLFDISLMTFKQVSVLIRAAGQF